MLRPFCLLLPAFLMVTALGARIATGAEIESGDAPVTTPIAESPLTLPPALELYPPGVGGCPPRLDRFLARHSERWEVRWDTRTDNPHLLQGPGIRLLDETTVRIEEVARRLLSFLDDHSELFTVRPEALRLDRRRSTGLGNGRWLIEFEQIHRGLPVIGAKVFMRLNDGRLVQFGSRSLTPVGLRTEPDLSLQQILGRVTWATSTTIDGVELLTDGGLAIYPAIPADERPGEYFRGAPGAGIEHRLGRRLTVRVSGDIFDLVIDAHSGELLRSRNHIHSADRQVSGEVAAIRRDRPMEDVPFPWVHVLNSSLQLTDAEGIYDYQGGMASTKLHGAYAALEDGCGPIQLTSGDGDLDFGGGGGDCQTPGYGGAGNTRAARTAYYYLSRAEERAQNTYGIAAGPRGAPVVARTNLPGDGCGAFYNSAAGTLDFERSASGCRNPGELPGLVLHEWGHAVFNRANDWVDGGSAEAAADTFSFLETGEPCIGHGYRPGVACRNCSPSCTGVRDLTAFALSGVSTLARPDTIEDDGGLDCDRLGCPYYAAGAEQYQGPMGYQAHCESQIASAANWDLAQRLVQIYGPERGWKLMTELWFSSQPAIGSAYRRIPAADFCHAAQDAVDGCEAGNWYTVFLALDDDDGNLANGTPNACTIWQAFDAHGIACGAEPPCFCAQLAIADAGPDLEVCAGEPVRLGTPARPGHAYSWTPTERPPGGGGGEAAGDSAQIVVTPDATTVYKLTATTACDDASDEVTVTVHSCEAPFDGDFEAGGIGWQSNGLWHLVADSPCSSPSYSSPVAAMYYGQDASCDYDTGGTHAGELISPWIDGITADSHLVFDFARAVELHTFDRDRAEVAIATAGGSDWDPRWARDALDPSSGVWTDAGPISLAPYAGQTIQVRFRFDTRDAELNGGFGWLVDDVAVIDLEPPVDGGAEPEILLLDPPEGGIFEACTCVPVSALADDAEDGDLAAIVRWSSDRDGPIGTGRSLAAALSVGEHLLSASVTDHDGQTTTQSVTVAVEPTEGCDLGDWPPAHPELFCGGDE